MSVDPEVTVLARPGRRGGRREWFRVARRELEAHRAQQGRPVPRDRDDRRFQALGRLEENGAYERWRVTKRDTLGRVLKGNSKPFQPPGEPDGQINLSDPDSRVMRTQGMPPRQAYNAQATVNERQIILAAEIAIEAADFGQLGPMVDRTLANLERHRVSDRPGAVIADAGYWNTAQIEAINQQGIEVLVPPDGAMRERKRPGWEEGPYDEIRDKLSTETGRAIYKQRKITIEPVYGQIKHNRGITHFMRRGRAAAQSEWRLVAATHNLLKLHTHWTSLTA
jgi:Transposase DDE domain